MNCLQCGYDVPTESIYCNKCGEKILIEQEQYENINHNLKQEVIEVPLLDKQKNKSKMLPIGIIIIAFIILFFVLYQKILKEYNVSATIEFDSIL